MIWKYLHSAEYLDLVREFPLTKISSGAQHEQAMAMLKKLAMEEPMGAAASDYFDVLAMLVKEYEDDTIAACPVTPQEALSFIMAQLGLSNRDIAEASRMQPSHVSEFRSGKRNLPKQAAAKLGACFNVDPMIFLPNVEASKVDIRTRKPVKKVVLGITTTSGKVSTVTAAYKAATAPGKGKSAAGAKKRGRQR